MSMAMAEPSLNHWGQNCAPDACHSRFIQKQQRDAQFTEDIRTLIYGGGGSQAAAQPVPGSNGQFVVGRSAGGAAGTRTRSPGLAAGATLALGSDTNARAEANALARQVAQRARGGSCPFDDHTLHLARDRRDGPTLPPRVPSAPDAYEAKTAFSEARTTGKTNAELQQRCGAGAPFDVTESGRTPVPSSAAILHNPTNARAAAAPNAGARRPPAVSASAAALASAEAMHREAYSGRSTPSGSDSPTRSRAFAAIHAEAAGNKSKMRGTADLISGGYLLSDSPHEARSNNCLPPKPGESRSRPMHEDLLPAAQMRVLQEGGTCRNMPQEKIAFLNSQAQLEANRCRNMSSLQLGGS
eukprot:gnl/TRDRNA2_/TRDRNA2_181099_c0_seq1.p1 gnl/TRDRNA2_/TRDRNA2_181099_c0~~gnl/TRDRNA2_/TRDRNA2_181099_c0_seq1.p1  ORF type:complete len:378 (+),score=67.25 gnl/TRDRNA2_/TRDRNA2_181099_c0_seq1:69-1136(+)